MPSRPRRRAWRHSAFAPTNLHELRLPTGAAGADAMWSDFLERIDDYAKARDFPAVKGPSYLRRAPALRHAVDPPLARAAWQRTQGGSMGAQVWLSELIWRDFYHQILHHHPHVVGHAFQPRVRRASSGSTASTPTRCSPPGARAAPAIRWSTRRWRQINSTGYMHNRLRMVTASFLVKDLGIDWRRGEALLRRAAERLRPRRQQRRLAVGRVDRLRRAAVLPHLQPGDAEREVRPAGQVHPPLPAAARQACPTR